MLAQDERRHQKEKQWMKGHTKDSKPPPNHCRYYSHAESG